MDEFSKTMQNLCKILVIFCKNLQIWNVFAKVEKFRELRNKFKLVLDSKLQKFSDWGSAKMKIGHSIGKTLYL